MTIRSKQLAAILLSAMLALGTIAAHAAEDPAQLSIQRQPAELIAAIYQAFHDWRLDAGIAWTAKAIAELDPALRQNPEMELDDLHLKTRKVRQVASALHTLLGMLDQRKALKLQDDESMRKEERMQALAAGEVKPIEVDIEGRIAVERESARLSAAAVAEFRAASTIDPANPSPHYQLAKVYAQALPDGATGAAEEEYYRSAVCSLDEGDSAAAESTLRTLAALNPQSAWIARFEERSRSAGPSK